MDEDLILYSLLWKLTFIPNVPFSYSSDTRYYNEFVWLATVIAYIVAP